MVPDQVQGANWNDSDVKSFNSDEISYHGDSDQEAAHNIEQFVDNAKAANRSLIARTKFLHLAQFVEALEGEPSTLEVFRAHMQREADQGRYPFTVLPPGSQEDFLDP